MKIEAADFLSAVAARIGTFENEATPFWHPLGFVSTVIEKVAGSHTLRLHYWPANERRTKNPDWPIHTHSYALSSLVLAGSIEDMQYEVGEGNEYCVYKVQYFEGGSEITKTDRTVSVRNRVVRAQRPGDQYRVERNIFHQSSVAFEESAVTLVALSEIGSDPPLVLGSSAQDRYPYDRSPFDPKIFWSEVRAALGAHGC